MIVTCRGWGKDCFFPIVLKETRFHAWGGKRVSSFLLVTIWDLFHAQVRLLHHFVILQALSIVAEDDLACLQYVAAVGDG